MKTLSQKNPAWGYQKIGDSNATIASYGCLITSLSMLSDWYGKYKNPSWMAKNLKFTKDGLLYWNSITSSELPMKFVYRYYSRDDKKIKEILYSKDNACILRVVLNHYQHWVVLLGYSRLYGYKIADPIDGKVKYLKYPITGFAEVAKK